MNSEQPWMPQGTETAATYILANPNGTTHLAFEDSAGNWQRIWQHAEPTTVTATEAILMRPLDIDEIIKVTCIWITGNPDNPHAHELSNELAQGAKRALIRLAALLEDPARR